MSRNVLGTVVVSLVAVATLAGCAHSQEIGDRPAPDPLPPPVDKELTQRIKAKFDDSIAKIPRDTPPTTVLKIAAQIKANLIEDFANNRRDLYRTARLRREQYDILTRGSVPYRIINGNRERIPQAPEGAGHFKWSIDPPDASWEYYREPDWITIHISGSQDGQFKKASANDKEFGVVLPSGDRTWLVHSFAVFKLKDSEIEKRVKLEVADLRDVMDK